MTNLFMLNMSASETKGIYINTMTRHQINLSDEQFKKLKRVQATLTNEVSGLPKFGKTIAYLCDKVLTKRS